MPSLPRIITVDPSGRIPQQIKNAVDLMDRAIVQIVIPTSVDALEELRQAKCTAVISAWSPGGMPGWELAAKIKQIHADTPVILIADVTDPELDEEMKAASPFIYLHRPFEIAQFLRVIAAALDGEDVRAALKVTTEVAGVGIIKPDYGPVPEIQRERAQQLVHGLMTDVNAMATLLCTRDGQVVVEQGVVGYMNRDDLAEGLVPAFMTGVTLREMVGGNLTELQFFDGDDYDVYLLSVGFHYFLVVIFDGQQGARQLGAVSRFGRRIAEDIIALMGMEAWIIRKVEVEKKPTTPRLSEMEVKKSPAIPDPAIELERAEIAKAALPEPEPVIQQLEAIPDEDFNIDDILGGAVNSAEADDLFSLDSVEEMTKEDAAGRKNTLDWDTAINLGILPGGSD